MRQMQIYMDIGGGAVAALDGRCTFCIKSINAVFFRHRHCIASAVHCNLIKAEVHLVLTSLVSVTTSNVCMHMLCCAVLC